VLAAQQAPAQQAAVPPSFDTCARPPGTTWTYDDLLCLNRVGRQRGALDEARKRLRGLGAGEPAKPWPTLVLAHATVGENEAVGVSLYETAAQGFVRSREAAGEVVARQNLRNLYRLRGLFDAARRQVELAVAAAEASGEPLTIARASVIQAEEAMETGGDIGRAHRVLVRAAQLASAAPIGLRRTILFDLASARFSLGLFDEAIDALEGHRALRAEDGSPVDAAAVAFNLLNVRLTRSEGRPLPGDAGRLVSQAESVLAEAEQLQAVAIEAQAHQTLGDLTRSADPRRSEAHLQRCLALEADLRYPSVRANCLWSLALLESTRRPDQADRLSREAVDLVAANPGGRLLAYAWQARLRLVWRALPENQAMAQSLEALDAIERLRAQEAGEAGRATLFGNWGRDYYWLTGRLLQLKPSRLAQAFEVGERMRSRVLLDRLASVGVANAAGPGAPDPSSTRARDAIAGRIADTQRKLLGPTLDAGERRALLDGLRLLELERDDLDDGRTPAASAVDFASLDAVQAALRDDEALMWFSIAPWTDLYGEFGGGTWVVALTRQTAAVHPLNGLGDLHSQLDALTGLVQSRETPRATWASAARRLGNALFGTAVATLPPHIKSLVVVSDGPLHRTPIELLETETGPALGERFEISVVPSATLWIRLRGGRRPLAQENVLVLADPDVAGGSLDGTSRFAPLPGARREALGIARTLALEDGHVLEGLRASEHALKNVALATYGVVHFAAHARADAAFPDRAAVFLAPGADREDGWLQPREIAALDLDRRLIVLSACESAEGSVLQGEGPLSLARAFFAGGAIGVVATRWPLRDDDAAAMMDYFYRALGRGASVGAALRQARLDAIAAGLPPAAWAGVALLGDGGHVPFTPRSPRGTVQRTLISVALAVLVVSGVVALARAFTRRSARPSTV